MSWDSTMQTIGVCITSSKSLVRPLVDIFCKCFYAAHDTPQSTWMFETTASSSESRLDKYIDLLSNTPIFTKSLETNRETFYSRNHLCVDWSFQATAFFMVVKWKIVDAEIIVLAHILESEDVVTCWCGR